MEMDCGSKALTLILDVDVC